MSDDETKHTPGPWVQRESNPLDVEGPANRFVASCENAADARLIASTLDVLAALKTTQAALVMMTEPVTIASTTMQQAWATAVEAETKARAAIAKAEGRPANPSPHGGRVRD